MRWLVERTTDVFEDYGYDLCAVLPSGALMFQDGPPDKPRNTLILAPGQWISVCEDADA